MPACFLTYRPDSLRELSSDCCDPDTTVQVLRETNNNFVEREIPDIQIEEFEGKIDSSYVRWVNDCEMILSPIKPKKMSEKKNIFIKILTTNDSSYTYEYSYLGESNKLKAKAIRIR